MNRSIERLAVRGIALSLVTLSAACGRTPTAPLVRGSLTGTDGRPLSAAVVEIQRPADGERLAIVAVADGRFELESPVGGALLVRFSAEDHAALAHPIWAEARTELEMRVELQADGPGRLTFSDPDARPARYARALRMSGDPDHRPSDEPPPDDPLLLSLWLFDRLDESPDDAGLEPAEARRALETLPADWPGWSFFPDQLERIAFAIERGHGSATTPRPLWQDPGLLPRYLDYLETAVATHPDTAVRPAALYHQMRAAFLADRDADAHVYLVALLNRYPGSPWAERARRVPDPYATVAPGKPIPDYRLQSIDDPTTPHTRDAMLGRVYLMDFWATWCVPCLAEMENLHGVHERYRDRGFEILSVNTGEELDRISGFRAGRWSMPWRHAWMHWPSPEAERFEVPGIPRTILVGRDGTILEARNGVLGDELARMVERALEDRAMTDGR